MPPAASPPPTGSNPDDIPRVPAVELHPIGYVRTAYRDLADTHPLVRPGRQGLEAAGLHDPADPAHGDK
jgi:hypothetical protein